jgi:hypothetical protein
MSTTWEANPDLREAAAEVRAIADGLSREAIDQRARQAFDWANECRARYQSILDVSKRSVAVRKAFAWAEILDWLDETGETAFSDAEFGERQGPSRGQAAAGWLKLFWFPGWVRAWRVIFGTEPIVFYEWTETAAA